MVIATCVSAFLLGAMVGFALPFIYFGFDARQTSKNQDRRRRRKRDR